MIFAITDIETTGSFAQGNAITEIAICLFDGEKIIDTFESLINPGKPIPIFIERLTGISDGMVVNAPTFEEVAPEIEAFTKDTVFVAHNVNFDYSFIKNQMEEAGISWNRPKLCTVRLARKTFIGLRSYSLGSLCNEFGINNKAAHRAMGDTRATVELFSKILANNGWEHIDDALKRGSGDAFLPKKLDKMIFHNLPEDHGVYYLHDAKGKIVYIGKAKNIKKRIRSHFSGLLKSKQKQGFLNEVQNITFQLTGSELLALLLEDIEIKKHWPKYNSAQKHPSNKFSIVKYEDRNGYLRLGIHKGRSGFSGIRSFHSPFAARQWLYKFAAENGIAHKFCGLPEMEEQEINLQEHNQNLKSAIAKLEKLKGELLLRLPGRSAEEYAVVKSENGQFHGFGYVPLKCSFGPTEEIESLIEPYPSSATTDGVLQSFLDQVGPQDLIFV